MKITVHRPNQIGGCITEITSNSGTRIIIDIGSNLPGNTDGGEVNVEKLTEGCDGVFITHYHGDHTGEYKHIAPGVKTYMGDISKKIFLTLQERLSKSPDYTNVKEEDVKKITDFETFKQGDKITINDMTVTPLLADHSAFDSYMFLIEADDQRILHTGDFRGHGTIAEKALMALKDTLNGKKIDVLIIEGTMLSRPGENVDTEEKLSGDAEKLIKQKEYIFIMCSSTNIDRIAAFYNANNRINKTVANGKSKKLFVCDDYQKSVLDVITNETDHYDFSGIVSFNRGIYQKMKSNGFCMLVRNNCFSKKFLHHPDFMDNLFIYSQWKGYLTGETKDQGLVEFVPGNYKYLHTSGHAVEGTIRQFVKIVNPDVIIPIHGEDSHNYDKLILGVIIEHLTDKQSLDVRTREKTNNSL